MKEDFQYIGGFRNRNENRFDSFANAQKQFDLKMMSLKEAANKTDFNISSWDLDKKENTTLEITGRHDPCICPRVTAVAESVTAIVLADHMICGGFIHPTDLNKEI